MKDWSRDLIGKSLDPDKLDPLNDVVTDMITNKEQYSARIRELREKSVFNIGHAAEAAAKYILSSLLEKKKSKK